ncbi:MAG: hypothetical protein KBT36_09455 [Kurthia sp.]|nr:hypothetical protein [Candidatus Kurthia equi]
MGNTTISLEEVGIVVRNGNGIEDFQATEFGEEYSKQLDELITARHIDASLKEQLLLRKIYEIKRMKDPKCLF